MKHIRLVKKIKEVDPGALNRIYENLIVKKIREKYSVNQELAILRQKDTKPEEFAEYNNYVEQCKAAVKKDMDIE
jgi:hypothetical protein